LVLPRPRRVGEADQHRGARVHLGDQAVGAFGDPFERPHLDAVALQRGPGFGGGLVLDGLAGDGGERLEVLARAVASLREADRGARGECQVDLAGVSGTPAKAGRAFVAAVCRARRFLKRLRA
jgi:hypothetical protein